LNAGNLLEEYDSFMTEMTKNLLSKFYRSSFGKADTEFGTGTRLTIDR